MIRWFSNLVYCSVPAEFPRSYGLDESVRRLADATGRTVFSALTSQRAVGTVTQDKVSLQRAIPFTGNSFKPFFIGRFEKRGDHALLVGRFTMHRWSKVFISIWFGFVAFWIGIVVAAMPFQMSKYDWWGPLFGIGMFAAGVALVWGCRWLSRNDPVWLSRVISQALDAEPPNSRFQADVPQAARA